MNNSNKMYHGWIDFYRETKMLTAKDAVQKALVNVRRLLKHKTLDPDQRKEAKNIDYDKFYFASAIEKVLH